MDDPQLTRAILDAPVPAQSARRRVFRACWRGLAWRGQGGGQPGEQDVQAAFEFGGAVIAG
jgi:hypothetical protein